MKSVTIVVVLFLLPFSVWAGTFLETFDHKELRDWQELVQGIRIPVFGTLLTMNFTP